MGKLTRGTETRKVTPETVTPPTTYLGRAVGEADPETGEVWTRRGWRTPEQATEIAEKPLAPHEVLAALKEQGATIAEQYKYVEEHPEAARGAEASRVVKAIRGELEGYVEKRVLVEDEQGKRLVDIEHKGLAELEKKEQFTRAIELGFVPKGSQYVEQGKTWGYLTPVQVEQQAQQVRDIEARRTRDIARREAGVGEVATEQQAILEKLDPYRVFEEDELLGYDLVRYLKDNPEDTTILTDAGFETADIEASKLVADYTSITELKEPISKDYFVVQYFTEKGWELPTYMGGTVHRGVATEAQLAQLDIRLIEASKSFREIFGVGEEIKSGFQKVATMFFRPARALYPETLVGDIKAWEWVVGGGQILLLTSPIWFPRVASLFTGVKPPAIHPIWTVRDYNVRTGIYSSARPAKLVGFSGKFPVYESEIIPLTTFTQMYKVPVVIPATGTVMGVQHTGQKVVITGETRPPPLPTRSGGVAVQELTKTTSLEFEIVYPIKSGGAVSTPHIVPWEVTRVIRTTPITTPTPTILPSPLPIPTPASEPTIMPSISPVPTQAPTITPTPTPTEIPTTIISPRIAPTLFEAEALIQAPVQVPTPSPAPAPAPAIVKTPQPTPVKTLDIALSKLQFPSQPSVIPTPPPRIIDTKLPQRVPPIRIPSQVSRVEVEKKRQVELPQGSIAFAMGLFWKYLLPPWTQRKLETLPIGVIPMGAINIDSNSPYKTIQMIGKPDAEVPETISADMGITDIEIYNRGRSIRFAGRGTLTNAGERIDSTVQGLSIPSRFGDEYGAESIFKDIRKQPFQRPEARRGRGRNRGRKKRSSDDFSDITSLQGMKW